MLADLFKLQMDLVGARGELAAGLAGSWLLRKVAPRGDGRPVITFPGFMASELTLVRLNSFLRSNGFSARGWGQGRNLGPQEKSWDKYLEELHRKTGDVIKRVADEHGQPVSLIGQSLGGIVVRELGQMYPDHVDRVLMLGSPTFHPYLRGGDNRFVAALGYWVNRRSHMELAGRGGLLHWDADHPPVPCVAFHSPIDGVVDELSSMIPTYIVDSCDPAAPRENVRVFSTHTGMGVNPWVLLAVADRLLQDRADWQAFDPYGYFPKSMHSAVPLLFPPYDDTQAVSDLRELVEPT